LSLLQIPQQQSKIDISVEVDKEKLKEDSKIYPNVSPGGFLYDYRNAVNNAAFKFALEDPTLVYKKGHLQSMAQANVDKEGYMYKKKKSRSPASDSSSDKVPKLTPSLRSKRITDIEEDLKEIRLEETLLEKARSKARTLNQDEKARHLTQELNPVRVKKRKLEDELCALQKKEAKAMHQKRVRSSNKAKTVQMTACSSQNQRSSQQTIIKMFEMKEGKDSASNSISLSKSDENPNDPNARAVGDQCQEYSNLSKDESGADRQTEDIMNPFL